MTCGSVVMSSTALVLWSGPSLIYACFCSCWIEIFDISRSRLRIWSLRASLCFLQLEDASLEPFKLRSLTPGNNATRVAASEPSFPAGCLSDVCSLYLIQKLNYARPSGVVGT